MTVQQTILGLPLNPIDGISPKQPVKFTNLFNNYRGQPLYMPNGLNADGTIGCPDGTKSPVSAFNYLRNKREIIEKSAQQRPLIRLADKNLNVVGELTGELSLDFEELMSDSGTARYVVRYDNWLVDYMVNLTRIEEDLHLLIDPNPLKPTWRTRWGGKIHTINIARHDDGTSTVELLAISNREHAKKLLYAANPFFPPEIQLPKMWLLPGPVRSVLFMSGFVNLARLFVPGLSFLTNIFNPASWVNPLNTHSLFNVDPLSWPIQIAFVNPILDQSRWTVLGATWTTWHDATQDILKDSGVMMRAYTWLTEDEDSPYEELGNLFNTHRDPTVSSAVARPTRNCVVFRFEDKSGHRGPTGSALDGLLNVIGVTLDDLLSSTLINANTGLALNGEPVVDVQGNSLPIFESLLGVAPEVPKVIWREGQFTGLIEATHTLHKGAPRTVMTGGRSPALVNQLQCVSGDTIVDGPEGAERIDKLAEGGGEFAVWSVTPDGLRVPATALYAFKKGTAELFEFSLEDGRSIKATNQHRFLTNMGFIPGADIEIGAAIATVNHEELPTPAVDVAARKVSDAEYETLTETAAVNFRKVVAIRSVGIDDFYDMHVPGWENYSANGIWNHNTFGIRYGLSQLSDLINIGLGTFVNTAFQMPGATGLENLYQGQLDNSLLAWERLTDPIRALVGGELDYQEVFERGSSTAYTLSGILTLRAALWKTRSFQGFKARVFNGRPWTIDEDTVLGDRNGFEFDGVIYVDQISGVKRSVDRRKALLAELTIGEDKDKFDPMARTMRAVQGIYTMFSAFVGEGILFG